MASGIFPDDIKGIQIDPHSHARWVNVASRLIRIWCPEHGLEGQDLDQGQDQDQELKVVNRVYHGLKLR